MENEVQKRAPEIVRLILEWAKSNYREFPWRAKMTPYRVLIAEILLKRTTATAASRIYDDFIKTYSDIETLAKAETDDLENLLQTIGYHKQRSHIMMKVSQFILDKYNGEIPSDLSALLIIPYIGPYTAGAILSLGFNVPSSMVDSNVLRIYKRVFQDFLPDKAVDRVIREIADKITPKKNHKKFNFGLLDLSAKICSYRKTDCDICPLNVLCNYSKKNRKV